MSKVTADPPKTFRGLVSELQNKGVETPRTLIYCRRVKDCAQLFRTFQECLPGSLSFHPPDAIPCAKNRLYAMFHQSTEQEIKETVIRSFKKTESTCRVVIATIALVMGMNFPDVRRVVNYGPPNSLEQYVQQCGRARRDQKQSSAILLWHGRQTKTCDDTIISYLQARECRRKFILREFGWTPETPITPQDLCCDDFSKKCDCTETHQLPLQDTLTQLQSAEQPIPFSSLCMSSRRRRLVLNSDRELLHQLLQDVRHRMAAGVGGKDGRCHSYTSEEVTAGLADSMIMSVIRQCDLFTTSDSQALIDGLSSHYLATTIIALLDEVFDDIDAGVDKGILEALDISKYEEEALHIEGMSDNDAEDSTDELIHGLMIGDC